MKMKGKENDEFGLNYSWNTKEDLDTLSKIYKEELQRGRNSIDLNNLKIMNSIAR